MNWSCRQPSIGLEGSSRTIAACGHNIAMEGEGLLGVIRMAAVNHEARYYMLRKARYPASRAEDMRRREVEVARSPLLGHWPGMRVPHWIQTVSPTSPAQDNGNLDESSGDELFGSD